MGKRITILLIVSLLPWPELWGAGRFLSPEPSMVNPCNSFDGEFFDQALAEHPVISHRRLPPESERITDARIARETAALGNDRGAPRRKAPKIMGVPLTEAAFAAMRSEQKALRARLTNMNKVSMSAARGGRDITYERLIGQFFRQLLSRPEAVTNLSNYLVRVKQFSEPRAQAVIEILKQGTIDRQDVLAAAERQALYEALLSEARFWPLSNHHPHTLGTLPEALATAQASYFGDTTATQITLHLESGSSGGHAQPMTSDLSTWRVDLGMQDTFLRVYSAMIHEMGHVYAQVRLRQDHFPTTVALLSEGLAQDFMMVALGSILTQTAEGPDVEIFLHQVELEHVGRSPVPAPFQQYHWGYVVVKTLRERALRSSNPAAFRDNILPRLIAALKGEDTLESIAADVDRLTGDALADNRWAPTNVAPHLDPLEAAIESVSQSIDSLAAHLYQLLPANPDFFTSVGLIPDRISPALHAHLHGVRTIAKRARDEGLPYGLEEASHALKMLEEKIASLRNSASIYATLRTKKKPSGFDLRPLSAALSESLAPLIGARPGVSTLRPEDESMYRLLAEQLPLRGRALQVGEGNNTLPFVGLRAGGIQEVTSFDMSDRDAASPLGWVGVKGIQAESMTAVIFHDSLQEVDQSIHFDYNPRRGLKWGMVQRRLAQTLRNAWEVLEPEGRLIAFVWVAGRKTDRGERDEIQRITTAMEQQGFQGVQVIHPANSHHALLIGQKPPADSSGGPQAGESQLPSWRSLAQDDDNLEREAILFAVRHFGIRMHDLNGWERIREAYKPLSSTLSPDQFRGGRKLGLNEQMRAHDNPADVWAEAGLAWEYGEFFKTEDAFWGSDLSFIDVYKMLRQAHGPRQVELDEAEIAVNEALKVPALEKTITPEIMEALESDASLRPVFLIQVPPLERGPLHVYDDSLLQKIGGQDALDHVTGFLAGTVYQAAAWASAGYSIIVGVADTRSIDTMHDPVQVANGRQCYFPLSDGTWLGVKGIGQLHVADRPAYYWREDQKRFEGLVDARQLTTLPQAQPLISEQGHPFVQTVATRELHALPGRPGQWIEQANLPVSKKTGKPPHPNLVFNRVLTPHRLVKFPQLLRSDPQLKRLTARLNRVFESARLLPQGTTLQPSDLLRFIASRLGWSEGLKQNREMVKGSLDAQDFTFGGEEADNEEFLSNEDFLHEMAMGRSFERGDMDLLRKHGLSTIGLHKKLMALTQMMLYAENQGQRSSLFPQPMEVIIGFYRNYLQTLDNRFLQLYVERPDGRRYSAALEDTWQGLRLDLFHPESDGLMNFNEHQLEEIHAAIQQAAEDQWRSRQSPSGLSGGRHPEKSSA